MSFIIGQIQQLEDNRITIRRVSALALGSEKGLFARHLPDLAKSGDGNWSLTGQELLKLENPEVSDDVAIFFELPPRSGQRRTLFNLVDVYGSTKELSTDALFRFKVLEPIDPQPGSPVDFFTSKNWENGADRYEQMRLEGGVDGGKWSWSEPPQAIGATVLRPAKA